MIFTNFADVNTRTARFELVPGVYTVSVEAEKFADYAQSVQVQEGYVNKVRIGTAETVSEDKIARKGWLRPGDVDHDGIIAQEDAKAVLEAIRKDPQGTINLQNAACLLLQLLRLLQVLFAFRALRCTRIF